MNVKNHLVRTKAHPAVPTKTSFENSNCTLLGVPLADGSTDTKINLWFGVEDSTEFLLNFKLLTCLQSMPLTQ